MGLADALIKMKIKYGSQDAIKFCNTTGLSMAAEAICKSAKLAIRDGAYPKFDMDAVLKSDFLKANTYGSILETIKLSGLRNSQLLTIAPTGSLSTMIGVSGGIEPIYANYYTRKTESLHGHDEYYKVYTPIVREYMESHGLTDDSQLPDYFVTAQTLNYKDRLAMQAAWQKHIDASISSTVNVPNDFTVEETIDLYRTAHQMGLKGVTIFRDGCKRAGILTTTEPTDTDENEDVSDNHELKRGMIIKADDNCIGKKRTLRTGCGSLHCEAFFDPDSGELLETYLSKGSTGGCNNFMIGLSRMISLAARGGIDIYAIVDQLGSCGSCPSYAVRSATKHDTSKGSCCPAAIGNALIDMYEEMKREIGCEDDDEPTMLAPDKTAKEKAPIVEKNNIARCPECGEPLIFEGGCNICKACGYTKCD